MPIQVYALITLFVISGVVLGLIAVRVVALTGLPTGRTSYMLAILAALVALYAIGHRLGLSLGPEVELFGFQVALLGDWLIGFIAAFATALAQSLVVVGLRRARRG